jgi:hypothetical protein
LHSDSPLKLAEYVTINTNRSNRNKKKSLKQSKKLWTHRDVFRLCHPKSSSASFQLIVRFVTLGHIKAKEFYQECLSDPQREKIEIKKSDDPKKRPRETIIYEMTNDERTKLNLIMDYLNDYVAMKDKTKGDDEKIELFKKNKFNLQHIPNNLITNSIEIWKELIKDEKLLSLESLIKKQSTLARLNVIFFCIHFKVVIHSNIHFKFMTTTVDGERKRL